MSAKNNIQLSILIPSIPSRFDRAKELYNNLLEMVGEKQIEIVLLMDNKVITIGEKQNRLMQMANGKYFCFIHDDDCLVSLDEIYDATFKDVDVICFKARCLNNDGSEYIVTQRLGNEVEHNTKDGKYLDCNRPPFPNCVWNSRFKKVKFPDISYSEDWEWVQKCLKSAQSEVFIDKVLFNYNFNSEVTEASTESNEHWVNPNPDKVYKRCVINLSTEKYWKGQDRLVKSIYKYSDYVVFAYSNVEDVGAPPHKENNYAFKPYSFIKAYEMGHRQILWLDASIRAIKGIKPIFDIIDKDGYFFQNSGWINSRWTNDRALEYFGTNEGEMLSSGVLGLDLDSEIGYKFFDQWTQAMRDGIFNGDWDNHRHDQTCASLIAYKLGMKLQDGNTFFVYGKEDEPTISDKTVLLADGIC